MDDAFYEHNPITKGRYVVENDTIKMIAMDKSGQAKYWLQRTYLKIENKETLRLLYFAWDDKIPSAKDFSEFRTKRSEQERTYFFREGGQLPDWRRIWMLDYKWYWCDEIEYKAYRNGMNPKK